MALMRGGEDVVGDAVDLLRIVLEGQGLRQRGDTGQWIADLVRDPGGKAADGGQAIAVGDLGLELGAFGHVLDQDHAAFHLTLGILQFGAVQVQAAVAVGQIHVQLVPLAVRALQEGGQQAAPGAVELADVLAHGVFRGDLRELRQGLVPAGDLAGIGEAGYPQRELVQDLAMKAAQGVQLGRQAGQRQGAGLQLFLDPPQAFAQGVAPGGIQAQVLVDDHARQYRPQQAGEIALDPFAEVAQIAA